MHSSMLRQRLPLAILAPTLITKPFGLCLTACGSPYILPHPRHMSRIAILGAGPAGLTLARLLERSHVDYIVYERDESASWAFGRSGSGTLDLHAGTGLLALKEAGLLEQFNSLARQNAPSKIADSLGQIYLDTSEERNNDKPEIDRRDLRELLLGSMPAEKIHWKSKVREVVRSNGSVSICFEDGRIESDFALVVGADGAWSKARKLVSRDVSLHAA